MTGSPDRLALRPNLMKNLTRTIFLLLFGWAVAATASAAAPGAYGSAADNKILAQALVRQIMAANPNLLTAGMHAVPPGGTVQKIIASTLNVIGKPSDPEDVEVGAQGFTHLNPNLKVPKLGVMLPLHDRSGKIIGALALAFKYRGGEDQVQYLAAATSIRDRVAQAIPSLADLFAPAP
jgi:hypothetical protein